MLIEDADKTRARNLLNKAVRDGDLARPDRCELCHKEGEVVGHHPDHRRPLEVIWCCRSCHWQIEQAEAERAKAFLEWTDTMAALKEWL